MVLWAQVENVHKMQSMCIISLCLRMDTGLKYSLGNLKSKDRLRRFEKQL